MNKKFFAALASATMAFTASGSIAVFADDFVEENTPSLQPGDLIPVKTKVLWDEEHFGDLANVTNAATWKNAEGQNAFGTSGKPTTLDEDGYVKTEELEKVTAINLQEGFKGEIKGLEYFTELTSFDDSAIAEENKVTNKALDFSANTKLETLTVKKAPELAEIKLPEADEDDVYHLETLRLENTKLTTLDLSKQEKLEDLTVINSELTALDLSKQEKLTDLTVNKSKLTILDLSNQKDLSAAVVTGNLNLKDVVLNNGKKGDPETVETLNLSRNALETVNLDYITFTELNLENNHIGALDLSKTTVSGTATLGDQKFYVSEKAKNVNLKEAVPGLKATKVSVDDTDKYDEETGVLTISGDDATYRYDTSLKNTNKTLTVNLVAANPMNRLYNPNSGEHFYTADIKEKEALVKLGWNDEGYGWVAPTEEDGENNPVFRLYNPNAGDHHYTMSTTERDTLVSYGWKDENVGWYSADAKGAELGEGHVVVYRQYNPYANGAGSHNYTTDKAENDYLVSLGWIYEGAAWTALQ